MKLLAECLDNYRKGGKNSGNIFSSSCELGNQIRYFTDLNIVKVFDAHSGTGNDDKFEEYITSGVNKVFGKNIF